MRKTDERQRRRNIERLADALQDCFDEAADAAADRIDAKWRPLVDQQNETLRMIWRQCGGKAEQRLPIDD